MAKRKVAIIGGGMTGLSAALYLQKEINAGRTDADYVLYEKDSRLGGRIETDYTDNFVIEKGPDSFLARKTSMIELAREIGMEDELVDNRSGAFILNKGKLYPMPEGAVMGIPTKWGPFVSTKLFSPIGKARAAMDLIRPRVTKKNKDISLGTFFRKRLGNEVVNHMIDPLLSGIYAGNIDKISLQATFPHFQTLEEKYRSLIIGMKTSMAKRQSGAAKTEKNGQKAKPKGMFLAYKNGFQSMVDGIEQTLDASAVHKDTGLEQIAPASDGRYRLYLSSGETDLVDDVILTTPHQHIYSLFREEKFADAFGNMPSTTVATVAMAFPESAVKKDIDGTGFVVAKTSDYRITACTWTHKKWPHSAPEGYALLRAYVGKVGDEEIVHESDRVISDIVLQELNQIMQVEGEPLFTRIRRWNDSMPQYEVGHRERIAAFRSELSARYPGIYAAGASFDGIGLPDCIDQGKNAVNTLMKERLVTTERLS
ncbi:protoporphyrinogen oxidase [Salisediminibacterium halotolerans]|uniref:Coproporphyrinogen III oxidase n=1 Tax=Salisediminibacterium halotolerans TaxID=517425 RepID=A0A1H9TGE5_9BACI|nr:MULTISPECIES: protoporphyrinogen oxidase [Salisediminibacterium]RLJ78400.1 oxygen-dependent protoporphyrinogen oxidase [Actinophytocola xinjiangensis]RPE85621.1 oxygen-dependent protoporphyrinogen oxidase [Salisediminibacterium halotolerans]TWG37376.1 oxygen-dependent protoporphyrinogen oxidase [Salisediminibacterium halotolerans]SER96097.1 oxygen-dependent protoporphyrinogen oxidase [Salisediminibacterium haloalkalitolerans]GEL08857.1 protoporphyrinogen oxidase [Salisediminibacterium halot